MKNIVLTGFMGAGKSSVGKELSRRLGMKVLDTDDVIEDETGSKISRIFEKYGEGRFREIEREVVEKVSRSDGHIIITGGGVVLDKENVKNLRDKGVIIYLHADPDTIYRRVKGESHRPLLQVKDPLNKIEELLKIRAPFYENHDIKIDTADKTVKEVAEEIVKKIKD